MSLSSVINVDCAFTTVPCAPLSPFVWVILKSIETFPAGIRPSFEEVAEKLSVQECGFIEQGWREAMSYGLFCSDEYQKTELSDQGRAALGNGFIESGIRQMRDESLYFLEANGNPVEWKHHYKQTVLDAAPRPTWADKLNEKSIQSALELQSDDEEVKIKPRERVFDIQFYWDEAQRVKLD